MGRLHISGGCYHVMGPGLERRNIFNKVEDKEGFLALLGLSLKKNDALCSAWAIMSNHYHLLIKVSANPLSKLMAPLLTGFAINYNRRKGRCGYVFQNHFRSILSDEDEYLLSLLRYIHLNPWKAHMRIPFDGSYQPYYTIRYTVQINQYDC
jgi:putative transposase